MVDRTDETSKTGHAEMAMHQELPTEEPKDEPGNKPGGLPGV